MTSSLTILDALKSQIIKSVRSTFDIELDQVTLEIPPRPSFGDLAFPIGFELAKRLKERTGEKQNPRTLTEQLRAALGVVPGIRKIEVAGPGYLNLFFDRVSFVRHPPALTAEDPSDDKVIVEHTSINPNKAAHIGHLRNAVLGDTLVRLLRASKKRVEIHNYIDNTGPQVADVVVGFQSLESMSVEQVQELGGKFDYYCWDLYAKVGDYYRTSPAHQQLRTEALHAIEMGGNPAADMAEAIATRILNCHLDTMERLGIRYDLLPRESEILRLKLWDRAFDLMKQAGVIVFESEGRNRGCWVMRADNKDATDGSGSAPPEADDPHDQDKILVRSNGTVSYTGKDIAYHLWKLGRLGIEFNYAPFRVYPDGHRTWITSSDPSAAANGNAPAFGNGAYYLSVIGAEQSYLQGFVKQALVELTHDRRIERSAHVGYEKVALTPAAIAELGVELEEGESGRQRIGMSGRRGLGVKVDDVIDRLEGRAQSEVTERHTELREDESRRIAHQIAVAALRYFLLKFTRTTAMVFDFKEALAFEGETGPYLQYSVVRANSILEKLVHSGLEQPSIEAIAPERLEGLLSGEEGDDWWSLLYLAARTETAIGDACTNLEPAILAKFAYQLAQGFNLFYHHYRIISEPDATRRSLLIHVLTYVRAQIVRTLDLLGIEVPECM